MKLSTNLICFHDVFGIKKTIDIFSEAGFEAIDFNTDITEYYSDEHDKQFYLDLKEYAQNKGIGFFQTHAPFSSSFPDEEKSQQRFMEIVRSISHSAWLGAEMIVVHPCCHLDYKNEENHKPLFDYNIDFYSRLIPYAQEAGIQIAIENIPNSITETSDKLLKLLDTLNNPVFTICYDVGHANRIGIDPAQMARELGPRIGCTHIHDNKGDHDSHLLPYHGNIDWESVMKAFAQSGYQGNLSYEAGTFVKNMPTKMRPLGANFMASIGHCLIDRFHFYNK